MSTIVSWHAHVYFTSPHEREIAAGLREQVAAGFAQALLGRWHDRTVGPHPQPMYQIAFPPELFATLVPFMALRRQGLTILVHPETGHPKADHAQHALWMGAVLPLDLSVLPETSAEEHA